MSGRPNTFAAMCEACEHPLSRHTGWSRVFECRIDGCQCEVTTDSPEFSISYREYETRALVEGWTIDGEAVSRL